MHRNKEIISYACNYEKSEYVHRNSLTAWKKKTNFQYTTSHCDYIVFICLRKQQLKVFGLFLIYGLYAVETKTNFHCRQNLFIVSWVGKFLLLTRYFIKINSSTLNMATHGQIRHARVLPTYLSVFPYTFHSLYNIDYNLQFSAFVRNL